MGRGRRLCHPAGQGVRLHHPIGTAAGSLGHQSLNPGAALEPLPALDSCDSSRVRWDRAATASRPWGRKVVFAARLRTQGLRWGVGRRACVYMCVPAPSAAWDRRLKEGNCQIGASC